MPPIKTKSGYSVLGRAMLDYLDGDSGAAVTIHGFEEGPEDVPIEVFMAGGQGDFSALELTAVELCVGRVLDAGAGGGRMSIALQKRGHSVCAIDVSAEAVEVMRRRGIKGARAADVFDFVAEPFDTVLLMMNGVGIAGDLAGLDRLFESLHKLVKDDGRVLLDSLDMRDGDEIGEPGRPYPGVVRMTVEYRGARGRPFDWLFVDPDTLSERALLAGFYSQVIFQDGEGQYLARLAKL